MIAISDRISAPRIRVLALALIVWKGNAFGMLMPIIIMGRAKILIVQQLAMLPHIICVKHIPVNAQLIAIN